MSKSMPATAAVKTTVAVAKVFRPERDSKNYDVFDTFEVVGGKSPILVGNDGRLYVHKSFAAAGKSVRVTVEILG